MDIQRPYKSLGLACWLTAAYQHRPQPRAGMTRPRYALARAVARRWRIALYVAGVA
jgi:hypothetical protein